MINDYIKAAMHKAKYEILEEDHTFYGEIPECQGVWSNKPTLEECREELESALEDWLLVGISLHHTLPVLDGIDMNAIYSDSLAA